jgi:hypothetical protein
MTASEPAGGQPQPPHGAVSEQRDPRVLRAARREPAGAGEEWRDEPLVSDDEANGGPGQGRHARPFGMVARAPRSSPTSASKRPESALGRAITMTAARGGAASRAARYASRSLRRARLRSTAPRIWRLTANPARRASASPHRTTREGRSILLPCLKSAWNSALLVNRSRRGKRRSRRSGVCDPLPAGSPAPSARPWLPCAGGTHGSSSGGGCLAGTCASTTHPPLQASSRNSVGTASRQVNSRRLLRRDFSVC